MEAKATTVNLSYEDSISRKSLDTLTSYLPNICIAIGLLMRFVFVAIIAVTFGYIFIRLYKEGHDFTALCIQYVIPILSEISFTLFSLVSAALYLYGDKRSVFFFIGAVFGLVYNGFQLWFLSDAINFGEMNTKVQLTLQAANFVAWGLVEGGALLTASRNNSVNQTNLQ
ncbi:hypothetical protein, partial [Bernardetia sp.]|uniref:hypothetical protein n=1 Tax=Bernardetia sp. TaxID=1937974 RepID=UPI0025B97BCE